MIYDPFQKRAIDYIKEGHSVIVSAPTGSGKTAIAEYVIYDCLSKNRRVVYTAPIKALSNQKFRDFQAIFKDKIGILTGDVSINPHAPVLIMTTEIFRNKILERESGLDEYSWIIFDEIHYLDDYERGTVWEESLIFLPEHMKMLALSATIPNIDELAAWLRTIHKRELKTVKEQNRPVPLHFYYQCRGDIVEKIKKISQRRYKMRPNRPTKLINHLFNRGRLPCIYFTFGRRRCESLAHEMIEFDFLDHYDKEKIKDMYEELCGRFDLAGERGAAQMKPLIEKGIAYHHAGMLPTLKEVVERLFTSRLIRVIFTTETFALGINMPARTVVFDELRKFYGRFFSNLRTRDFYQMAGRAGRRGIDEEGVVYSRVNLRYISVEELKSIIFGQPEKVKSRFNFSYATVLNLYQKYADNIYDIYPLSFHYFQEKERYRRKAIDLLHTKVDLLKELRFIERGALTEKGKFASKIYGYELLMAQLYSEGGFDNLTEIEMGILCLALVFEPRKSSQKPILSKRARGISRITETVLSGIHRTEKEFGIRHLSKDCFYHLSSCLEAWMRNDSFDKILRFTEADEGEVIRYFRMCIQILREILDASVSHDLKSKTGRAIDLINRDTIDAERQLRG